MLYLNEKPLETVKAIKLSELLSQTGRDPALTVVTVDGEFIPRAEYKNRALPDGARVRAWELQAGG